MHQRSSAKSIKQASPSTYCKLGTDNFSKVAAISVANQVRCCSRCSEAAYVSNVLARKVVLHNDWLTLAGAESAKVGKSSAEILHSLSRQTSCLDCSIADCRCRGVCADYRSGWFEVDEAVTEAVPIQCSFGKQVVFDIATKADAKLAFAAVVTCNQ
jgi:hypothetical protein